MTAAPPTVDPETVAVAMAAAEAFGLDLADVLSGYRDYVAQCTGWGVPAAGLVAWLESRVAAANIRGAMVGDARIT